MYLLSFIHTADIISTKPLFSYVDLSRTSASLSGSSRIYLYFAGLRRRIRLSRAANKMFVLPVV